MVATGNLRHIDVIKFLGVEINESDYMIGLPLLSHDWAIMTMRLLSAEEFMLSHQTVACPLLLFTPVN